MSATNADAEMLAVELSRPVSKSPWTVDSALNDYGISSWGKEYFTVNDDGLLCANIPTFEGERIVEVPLVDAVAHITEQGLGTPLMLRFPGFLDKGIQSLNSRFEEAIARHDYNGRYRGVFPIKVNQQHQVIDEISQVAENLDIGFECGSKPELIAALAYLRRPGALLVCNGYKDIEFIRLALIGKKVGLDVVIVIEMPQELDTVIECAEKMGIEPSIGFRLKLSAEGYGYWKNSAGERSPFGINSTQLLELVDRLCSQGRSHWISMLHCHQGSQITDLATVARSTNEACRVYTQLAMEGVPIRCINFGGGLAVDYSGLEDGGQHSPNYDTSDYADTIVGTVKSITDEAGVEAPDIVTESGRAIAAPYAALIAKIHDVATFDVDHYDSVVLTPDVQSPVARKLAKLLDSVKITAVDVSYQHALLARNEAMEKFADGRITLRERALCESIYWKLLSAIVREARALGESTPTMTQLDAVLADQVYANFSIFQSLPDAWAIGQLFPVTPLQRLDQRPTRRCLINDITCDCDGAIRQYVAGGGIRDSVMLHEISNTDDYYIGVFLVGAYQETLSDLHNLFGNTNVVSVTTKDGKPHFDSLLKGDSVGDALRVVRHDPQLLVDKFSRLLTDNLTPVDVECFLAEYSQGLHSSTYLSESRNS